MRIQVTIAVALGLAAGPGSPAHADRAAPVVLAVDGTDVYIDLGGRDGVGAGSELELLHEVVAREPRTGATLRDRFALGTLTVVKAGDTVCVALAPDDLAGRVMVGDRVELASARRTFVDPWVEQVAAGRAAQRPAVTGARPPAVDHAGLARDAWQDTLGRAPERRIERWAVLLEADPQTPYRAAIEAEVASLRAQIVEREAALARARSASPVDRSARVSQLVVELAQPGAERDAPLIAAPIDHASPGQPIALAILARTPAAIAHAWLYARAAGDPGFKRVELVRDGDAYLRGAIASELVHGDRVEWYIEVAPPSGPSAPALGSADHPRVIELAAPVAEPPIAQGRSHVDVHVDYVDWDGKLATGFDQYYQAEADFTYRFLTPVYAVRLGFGTLSGIGGPKDVIDLASTTCLDTTGTYRCKRVTFSYVYSEVELQLRTNVALLLRPQVGQLTTDAREGSSASRCAGRDVAGCELLTGYGGRVRLRLGNELGTNLVLGAGVSRGVGTLLEAAYHWLAVPVVPVQITVQVTDQPVPNDFGVRLIADVGWHGMSWFYPSLRVSYQARDINHSGVSGGLAMNFDW